ncbi:hypothetical protein [Blastomonas sp. UPD001]|uniref:hypothetical protein n=1 Tax=Blastomonas sp. UPD001 TaxID=2217673 RepID=UPI000E347AFF|nr:hypothetical protein [Blastomonas sp. UPD001]
MKTPRKPERRVLWIINPDLLTAKIIEHEGSETEVANLAAVQRIEAWLEASINTYQTIGVETVLSSPKYLRLVDLAHDKGFIVRMLYVVLDSVEAQYERVAIRVRTGGHDVPRDKIAARRTRSFEMLGEFFSKLDELFVFDNTTSEPKLIAEKLGPAFYCWDRIPLDMLSILRSRGVFIYEPKFPPNDDSSLG